MLQSAWRIVPPGANRCESWSRRGCATATLPAFVGVEGSSNELLSSTGLPLRRRESHEGVLPRQRLSPRVVIASYRPSPRTAPDYRRITGPTIEIGRASGRERG